MSTPSRFKLSARALGPALLLGLLVAGGSTAACSSDSSDTPGASSGTSGTSGTSGSSGSSGSSSSSSSGGSTDGGDTATVRPGTIDPAFGEAGRIAMTSPVMDTVLDGDGVAILAGSVWRASADGVLDASFNSEAPVSASRRAHMGRLADGSFVILAYSSNLTPLLVKVDRANKPVAGFTPAKLTYAGSLVVKGDAIYLSGGTAGDQVGVQKLTSTGAADPSFTPSVTAGATKLRGAGMAVAGDDSIFVAANANMKPAVVHFKANGALDTAFGAGGTLVLDGFGPRNIRSILPTSDGHIFVLGMTGFNVQIARIDSAGALDASFGEDGIATIPPPTGLDAGSFEAKALVQQEDGKLLVALDSNESPGTSGSARGIYVLRTDAQGKADPTFGTDGYTDRLEFVADVADSYFNQFYGMNRPMTVVSKTRLVIGGTTDTSLRGGLLAIGL